MDKKLFTFIETRWFSKRIAGIMTDEEYARMQWRLIQIPDIGDVIPGGGGIRKFRHAARSKGKRGGARVIYYYSVSLEQIFLLDIYTKNESADISLPRLRELKTLVDEWVSDGEGTI